MQTTIDIEEIDVEYDEPLVLTPEQIAMLERAEDDIANGRCYTEEEVEEYFDKKYGW
ncbi:MAG: hypothetical protein LBO69_01610 [Ignavibacteria bacterium]|jgi:hypothetical protein|nr:hypothetical protein [Ignavibacteria bacterium]